jgi:hypothetical protein
MHDHASIGQSGQRRRDVETGPRARADRAAIE